MKKVIFITAGIIVCIVFSYSSIKKRYTEKFLEFDYYWDGFTNSYPYEDYAHYHNLELPLTVEPILEEVIEFSNYIKDPENTKFYINQYLKDYLSKETPGFIHYIPLYNPKNNKIEGYILLSAGIDGKINNRYDWRDSLYLTDYKHKLKLYDSSKIISYFDTVTCKDNVHFNIFNYFFGKKDILIAEKNFIEAYKCRGDKIINLEELVKDVKYKSTSIYDFTYRYKGAFQKDTFMDNERYVFFSHNDYLIRNKMYSGRDLILSDTILFVGISDTIDFENKIIDMRSCIQVDENIEEYFPPATWK